MKKIARSIAGGSYTKRDSDANANKEYYSDLEPNLKLDTRTNDVSKVINVESVKNSLVAIISTRKGERPFEPDFGCEIYSSLFENMNDFSAYTIENSIKQSITNYEPRVRLKSVQVVPFYDQNMYVISITYHVITDLSVVYTMKLNLKDDL